MKGFSAYSRSFLVCSLLRRTGRRVWCSDSGRRLRGSVRRNSAGSRLNRGATLIDDLCRSEKHYGYYGLDMTELVVSELVERRYQDRDGREIRCSPRGDYPRP